MYRIVIPTACHCEEDLGDDAAIHGLEFKVTFAFAPPHHRIAASFLLPPVDRPPFSSPGGPIFIFCVCPLLPDPEIAELQGTIITAFRYPSHPHFQFEEFYTRLNDKGYVIYPG